MRHSVNLSFNAGKGKIAALVCLLFLASCGDGTDSSVNLPGNDGPAVNPDDNLVFSAPVYYLHGYVRSDQVGMRLLPVDETFEMQYSQPTFAARDGVLRVSGLCHDSLINTARRDGGLVLSDYRDKRPLGCQSSFINETLSDTARALTSVAQADFIRIDSTEDYLLFRPPSGELLAFSTRPLRANDLDLNEVDLSQWRWTLESVRTLDSGLAPVALDLTVSLDFGDGQNLELDLGCSVGTGGARVSSGIISVVDVSFTDSICAIDETSEGHPLGLIESFFTRANASPLAYSLRNDQLTLFNGRDAALVFSGRKTRESESLPAMSLFEKGDLTDGGLDATDVRRRTDIIRDQISLDAAYTALAMRYGLTQLETPVIDFNRYTVIAAFYGYDSHTGYDMVVRAAVESERGLDVYLTSRGPGSEEFSPGCSVGAAESAPFSFVLVDSRQTPVTTRIRETSYCSGLWSVDG